MTDMTKQPREFWISMCTFNDGYTEIYETRTAEFEPCPPAEKIHAIEAGPVLEKIRRLEAMLERCKDQRDWWIHEKYEGAETKDLTELIDRENKNLESILEGR